LHKLTSYIIQFAMHGEIRSTDPSEREKSDPSRKNSQEILSILLLPDNQSPCSAISW
ncbi:hypothetical protein AVEN_3087-2-1, partial [Araneus ventricosus]